MQVIPNRQLSVVPERGRVLAESMVELEVSLLPQQPGQFAAVLEVEVRGSRTLKLPIRCAMLLCCHDLCLSCWCCYIVWITHRMLQGAYCGFHGLASATMLLQPCDSIVTTLLETAVHLPCLGLPQSYCFLFGGFVAWPCCRAEAIVPCVHVAEGAAAFAPTVIGASSQLPLTLVNTTPVPATLLCDLKQQSEFELTINREDWSGAGYSACPVQRIGANGEMSTVGSKRASRR